MQTLRKVPLRILVPVFLVGTILAAVVAVSHDPYLNTKFTHHCFVANTALPDCYSTYYGALAEKVGAQGAIRRLRERSATDRVLYANCHNTMHTLGRVAYNAYGSLPASFQYADYFCWSGYYHGVVEGALRGVHEEDVTREALFNLCNANTTMPARSPDQFNCMHGIGHALMYMTGNDLPRALKRCENVGEDWSVQHCATGVFMENSLADGVDHKSTYLPLDDPHYPCTIVDNKFGEACYVVQSSLILKKFDGNFAQAFAFCLSVTEPGFRTQCARGLGKEAAQHAFYDNKKAAETCEGAPNELVTDCFFGAIGDLEGQFHDNNAGVAFCRAVSEPWRPSCESIITEASAQAPIQ